MNNISEELESWILSSGLVIEDEKDENLGGVHSYYDAQNEEYGFIYPEITGYFLSLLRFLHSREPKEKYLKLARNSGNWLIKIYDEYGGIIQGVNTDKNKLNLTYSFDTGICAKGLIDCFLITNDEKYLEYGKKLCHWIIDESLEPNGTIKPLKNIESGKFVEDTKYWYKQKGCLHLKVVMPLLQIYELTKEEKFLDAVNLISNTINLFKKEDGSIALHQDKKIIHLHSLCYALEGLLFAFNSTNNKNLLKICDEAIDWCCEKIRNDDMIMLWYNSNFQQAKTSYHIAQLMRIMLLVNNIHNNKKYLPFIEKLYKFLITFQAKEKEKKIDGGMYEEYYKSIIGWKKRKRINSWGSIFALQSIIWYNEKNSLDKNWIKSLY